MSRTPIAALCLAVFVACGGSSNTAADAGTATCSSPGQATPGAADMHCMADGDGGMTMNVQATSAASCHLAFDAGVVQEEDCPYGDTMFGMEGDDDDCKYHVK